MMLIGVISDTHIPLRAKQLPVGLFKALDGVALLLHAGDLVEEKVLEELSSLAPVEAVAGNMDPFHLATRLGRKKVLEVSGYRIGLIHGDLGSDRQKTPRRAYESFADDNMDCVVFGHTHQPYCREESGVLLFNPGSPTDRRRELRHSCGRLTLGDRITAEIIYL
jgi:putative phosphoesterase